MQNRVAVRDHALSGSTGIFLNVPRDRLHNLQEQTVKIAKCGATNQQLSTI